MHWFQFVAQVLLLITVVVMLYFAVMFYANRRHARRWYRLVRRYRGRR